MTSSRRTAAPPGGPRIRRRARVPSPGPRRRMAGLLAVYLLGLALLGSRLVQVQVVEADHYASLSVQQRVQKVTLPATRGRVYDRDGDVLATSVDSATIYADPRAYQPRELPDGRTVTPEVTPAEAAATLATLLDTDEAVMRERLASDAHFVYLARQVDWELGEQVLDLDLPGVARLTAPRRQYPAGSLASQVLGLTHIDGHGLEGLELAHEDLLAGKPGELAVEQAPSGLTIASGLRELTPAEPGTDLVLTIDREIQAVAEQAAQQAMTTHEAAGASVVVLDVATRDVLAMASVPGFDAADRNDTDLGSRRNRTVTDVFEPGSVQKAVTVAAAIDQGVVAPSTTFTVDDRLTIGPKTFRDSHDHPTEVMTVGEIVATSSNVGTMMIAQQLGSQRLYEYLQRFGYTEPTGVGFPGEVGGLLPQVEDWWVTSLPTIAIGQGVATTLLRAADVYATLANDGRAVQPRLVRGTVGPEGDLVPAPVESLEQVVSPETARSVRQILAGVLEEGGTGGLAAVPGYDVAGKTGTAQKPRVDGRGYGDGYIASFVGMAPVDDPELVVAVMVDEPTNGYYGGTVAGPVFAEVMEFALRARHVPPTEDGATLDESFASAATSREAAEAAAAAAAAQEGPAIVDGEPASPPVGAPVGGDGTGVAADGEVPPDSSAPAPSD